MWVFTIAVYKRRYTYKTRRIRFPVGADYIAQWRHSSIGCGHKGIDYPWGRPLGRLCKQQGSRKLILIINWIQCYHPIFPAIRHQVYFTNWCHGLSPVTLLFPQKNKFNNVFLLIHILYKERQTMLMKYCSRAEIISKLHHATKVN